MFRSLKLTIINRVEPKSCSLHMVATVRGNHMAQILHQSLRCSFVVMSCFWFAV